MKEELTQGEYIIAESRLHEVAEAWAIYNATVEQEMTEARFALKQGSSIIKFIDWVQAQGKKYKPVLEALIEFLREMRPLVLVGGKYALPGKYNVVKWIRIGWVAGRFVFKVIKILL